MDVTIREETRATARTLLYKSRRRGAPGCRGLSPSPARAAGGEADFLGAAQVEYRGSQLQIDLVGGRGGLLSAGQRLTGGGPGGGAQKNRAKVSFALITSLFL